MTYYQDLVKAVAERDRSTCWQPIGTQMSKFGHHQIRREGKGPHQGVHRLSLEAATGGRPPGAFACHRELCSGPWCWNPDHLYWGDAATNGRDVSVWGLTLRGEKNGRARLTEDQVRTIRELYATGQCTHEGLAAEFGVRRTTISSIIYRKNWKHVA